MDLVDRRGTPVACPSSSICGEAVVAARRPHAPGRPPRLRGTRSQTSGRARPAGGQWISQRSTCSRPSAAGSASSVSRWRPGTIGRQLRRHEQLVARDAAGGDRAARPPPRCRTSWPCRCAGSRPRAPRARRLGLAAAGLPGAEAEERHRHTRGDENVRHPFILPRPERTWHRPGYDHAAAAAVASTREATLPGELARRRVRRRAARGQLLGRLARDASAGSRVRVPYSPFFLQQVTAGNVVVDHLEGHGDPGDVQAGQQSYAGSKPTTRFKTEIPAFADTKALSQLLGAKKRRRQRGAARRRARRGGRACCVGFGPTILFLGLLFWLMRRAGGAQNVLGVVRPLARAALRAVGRAGDVRRRRRDRRGEGGADRGRRLPAQAGAVPEARRRASRTACC